MDRYGSAGPMFAQIAASAEEAMGVKWLTIPFAFNADDTVDRLQAQWNLRPLFGPILFQIIAAQRYIGTDFKVVPLPGVVDIDFAMENAMVVGKVVEVEAMAGQVLTIRMGRTESQDRCGRNIEAPDMEVAVVTGKPHIQMAILDVIVVIIDVMSSGAAKESYGTGSFENEIIIGEIKACKCDATIRVVIFSVSVNIANGSTDFNWVCIVMGKYFFRFHRVLRDTAIEGPCIIFQ
jgi:hypothetical protein